MASKLQILNRALVEIGEEPASTLEDDSEAILVFNAIYPSIKRELLAEVAWGFAIKTRELVKPTADRVRVQDTDYLGIGKDIAYILPSDCISILGLRVKGNSDKLGYRREGKYILAGDLGEQVIYLEYVADVGEDEFSAKFVTAIELKLAAQITLPLIENVTRKQELLIEAERARVSAISANSRDTSNSNIPSYGSIQIDRSRGRW